MDIIIKVWSDKLHPTLKSILRPSPKSAKFSYQDLYVTVANLIKQFNDLAYRECYERLHIQFRDHVRIELVPKLTEQMKTLQNMAF